MYKIIALAALVACASAAVYETETDEEVEAWTITATNDDNVDATARLIARVAAIESAAEPMTTAVNLAQTSMSRLDAVVDEVAALKRQLAEDVTRLRTYASQTGSANGLEWHKNRVVDKKWEIPATGRADRKKMVAKIAQVKERVDLKTAQVQEIMDGRMKAMESEITAAMDAVIASASFTGSDEHIKQVTGYYPDDIVKVGAWNGEEYTSTADNSEVRGRNFYSVVFNTKQKGFFTSGADEFFMACRALSIYMFRQDGVERDLRPPCNHYGHARIGGLGQCIWIQRSYFSHCGGGGYWRQNEACGGVPSAKLRNTVMYETNQHNWDRHMVHYDRDNHHGWVNSYQTSNYQKVLCTGGNQNFRTKFKARRN